MATPGLVCASCGAVLPSNSNFCNECGHVVARTGRSAQYKQGGGVFQRTVTPSLLAAAARAVSNVARAAWLFIATSSTQQSGSFRPVLTRNSAQPSGFAVARAGDGDVSCLDQQQSHAGKFGVLK